MKKTPITLAVVYMCLAGLVISLIYAIVQTYTLADAIREQQKTNVGTNERIVDCTTPGGKCYQQGQKRTGAAVADILKGATYAIACADKRGVQTEAEIQACVLKRIAKEKP
jgi:hypothetical protein